MRARLQACLAALALTVLAGCGGGAGSVAGIDRLGVTSGTVNGFGSVIVNGIRYEVTGTTQVRIDDSPGSQDDLEVGQQVTVRWRSDDDGATRTADQIDYSSVVTGPVATGSIDPVAGTFTVLGQVVRVTATTSFGAGISPADLTGLAAGQTVEVSGLLDAGGFIRATRIETRAPGQLEVRGVAATVTAQTFTIGNLVVFYQGANLPDGPLQNGDLVEAKGTVIDGLGRLVATVVEREDDFATIGGSADDIDLEGFITTFTSATDFVVAGVRVTTNAQTEYDDGNVTDLRLNARVEVEGRFNPAGVLVAEEIDFKSFDDDDDGDDDALDGRVAANVTAVNVAAGTVVAAGVTIRVTAATRLEDKRSGVRPFGLANLAVGDYIEARGTPGTGAELTASIFERQGASGTGRLRGPAGSIANPSFTVLGVPVLTSGATVFRDDDDTVIDAATFFGALANGSEVAVRFTQGVAPFAVLEAELEDDDDDDDDGDDDDFDDDFGDDDD
jgi:hypothetical protein